MIMTVLNYVHIHTLMMEMIQYYLAGWTMYPMTLFVLINKKVIVWHGYDNRTQYSSGKCKATLAATQSDPLKTSYSHYILGGKHICSASILIFCM